MWASAILPAAGTQTRCLPRSTSSVPPQDRVVLALAASGPGIGAAWERAQQQRLQEQGEAEEEEEKEEEGARRGERQPCGGSWRW